MTERAKHTAGPWKAVKGIVESDDMRCGVSAVRGKTEYLVATIENGAPGDFCETEEANARLIAACPDLLAALKALQLQALQSTVNDPANEWGQEALELTRAALSRATGEA